MVLLRPCGVPPALPPAPPVILAPESSVLTPDVVAPWFGVAASPDELLPELDDPGAVPDSEFGLIDFCGPPLES
jgi:hypothetical protein